MSAPSPVTPPPNNTPDDHPDDRLDSWKEIATYLNRDVTTVQRWEKREGMPVHRHLHDKMGSVYASRAELDAWKLKRNLQSTQESEGGTSVAEPIAPPPQSATPTSFRWKLLLPSLAAAAALVGITVLLLERAEYFWRSPIADARFQTITDFEGVTQAAAISRDGHFIAFLSDRDGPTDVWVTQLGSGEFHNLTHGTASELVNPSLRTLGFSPDGSLVTFWLRKPGGANQNDISVWAVPTLGGQLRPYLTGGAEYDWSHDGSRLAYHTPGPGDPLFVSDGAVRPGARPIFTAPAGLHSHFPLWSPDSAFIYFVQGSLPDKLDIWRIKPTGGIPEQITSQLGRVVYPVMLDRRTMLYLADDPNGSGPWLYSIDVEHRIPHRLPSGLDRYTSLAASADGRSLVATLSSPKSTLWRLPVTDSPATETNISRVTLPTGNGSSPRLGPAYILYFSTSSTGDSIWKIADGNNTELWKEQGAKIIGGPAISRDGQRIAFSIQQHGRALLYVMQVDGTNPRVISDSLDLQGSPAWSPDSQSITTSALDHGVPRLFRVPVDGHAPAVFISDYSEDPAWSPDGRFVVYSGPDIGTTFLVEAASADATAHPIPPLTLTRGARHVTFLPGGRSLIVLRGEIEHKNLWLIDLDTGSERQLTNFAPDFDIRDFDISPDGREVILERGQDHSNVVLLDLAHR